MAQAELRVKTSDFKDSYHAQLRCLPGLQNVTPCSCRYYGPGHDYCKSTHDLIKDCIVFHFPETKETTCCCKH